MTSDGSRFPHPVYAETVLAPLFEGVKTHFSAHMDAINRAHLVMLAETGILSSDDARRIAGALRDISAETDVAALHYSGEHEDYFFLVEAELRRRLGDLGGALHTARSRNDMDHTMFRLALLDRGEAFTARLFAVLHAFIGTAERERDTLIVAYTHGQPAQPSTFGHYLAAVAEGLLRDARRVEAALHEVDAGPMGAAAITTSGFPIDRGRMADLLGFRGVLLNSYGCIASVDYITGLYAALRLVFLHLGRLVQDFQFWSAFEVGQLRVPDALVQVSSIMPQKRNPVPVEHMRHLASVAAGRCETVIGTMHNTPFTDMNDSEGEVQAAGFGAFETGGRMLDLLAAFVPACSIDADRVRRNGDAACVTVTELADTLVRDEGLTFRQAHEIAAATSRAVIAEGVPLSQGHAAFGRAFEAAVGRDSGLDRTAFEAAVAPETFVARRDRPGGPATAALDYAFGVYRAALQDLEAAAEIRAARRRRAAVTLDAAFAALLEG